MTKEDYYNKQRLLDPGKSLAQISKERNYTIMRLRGMWGNAGIMQCSMRTRAVQRIIDTELESIGAISETNKRIQAWEQLMQDLDDD